MLQALQKASAGNFNLNSMTVAVAGDKIKTARVLISAGLGYQAGCLAGLGKYINDTMMVNETMSI